jgi:hypothetical protein
VAVIPTAGTPGSKTGPRRGIWPANDTFARPSAQVLHSTTFRSEPALSIAEGMTTTARESITIRLIPCAARYSLFYSTGVGRPVNWKLTNRASELRFTFAGNADAGAFLSCRVERSEVETSGSERAIRPILGQTLPLGQGSVCEDILALVWHRQAQLGGGRSVLPIPARRQRRPGPGPIAKSSGFDAATDWDLRMPQTALCGPEAHCLEIFTDTQGTGSGFSFGCFPDNMWLVDKASRGGSA